MRSWDYKWTVENESSEELWIPDDTAERDHSSHGVSDEENRKGWMLILNKI